MEQTKPNKPEYGAYVVEGEGDKAFWTRIGSGWNHKDGEGISIFLSALPLNGRLTIRKPKTDRDDQ